MTTSRDVDRLLADWLPEDGAEALRQEVLLAALTDARARPQHRRLGLPRPFTAPRTRLAVVLLLGLLVGLGLMAGGLVGALPSTPHRYAGHFSVAGSMTMARSDHSATLLLDGRVLLAGGSGGGGFPWAELYDPVTGTFTATGSMARGRWGHTATLLDDGTVLVAGGEDDIAELYDPGSGTFSTIGSPGGVFDVAEAVRLPDGRVLMVGTGDRQAVIYDPERVSFSSLDLVDPGWGAAVTVLADGGKALVIGGQVTGAGGEVTDGTDATESGAWVVDPDAGTYEAVRSLRGATIDPLESAANTLRLRRDVSAIPLADDKVLVVGGYAKTCCPYPIDLADLYDPASGGFVPTGSLTEARVSPSVTRLADGRVLVAGGLTWDGHSKTVKIPLEPPTASAEVYDPATGAFTPTGSMDDARYGHTATLLPDGGVLIAGGGDLLGGGVLASVEVYR